MATETLRCTEGGTPFKGVPSWLRTAKVTFTCTSCPKRGSRSGARFEPAIEIPRPVHNLVAETDTDTDADEVEIDLDEEIEMDFSEDDPDMKDEEV